MQTVQSAFLNIDSCLLLNIRHEYKTVEKIIVTTGSYLLCMIDRHIKQKVLDINSMRTSVEK